ncbi:MAG: hypothetical protein EA389_08680 [Ilumatobacter sp.]|nr:MAG: hypothetical protein EA389_08680 [Ilumatobacter sp.]
MRVRWIDPVVADAGAERRSGVRDFRLVDDVVLVRRRPIRSISPLRRHPGPSPQNSRVESGSTTPAASASQS